MKMKEKPRQKPLLRAGLAVGVGMGGFLDGIVFHQILQTHHMLTARIPKDSVVRLQQNMVWDGFFHVFTWIVTAAGIGMLFRARSVPGLVWSSHTFGGAILMGWGLFNMVEGFIDHHLLHLHHVFEPLGVSIYDHIFLLAGLALFLIGLRIIRRA